VHVKMSDYYVHIQDVVGKQESQEQHHGTGDCPECQEEPCWAERFCSIYLSDNQKEKARKKYPEDPEKGMRNIVYYETSKRINFYLNSSGQVPLPKCILNKVRNEFK